MVLNLDSAPGPELEAKLEALDGIIEAKLVSA